MKEYKLDGQNNIFELPTGIHEAACITTNGNIKKNGNAVMGAGIAKIADNLFHCSRDLAVQLNRYGNHTAFLKYAENAHGQFSLFSFPTKHNWWDPSDLHLIQQSAKELVRLCNEKRITRCFLPRPGCTNGKLQWTKVKTVLEQELDDRFIVVSDPRYDN